MHLINGLYDANRAGNPVIAIANTILTSHFRNEFACGMNGLLGHKSSYKTCNEADVLLLFGTDFPCVDFLPKKNIIVQIDRKPSRIGRRG